MLRVLDLYCPDKPWIDYYAPYDAGFFSDLQTITSRGSGLTVFVADSCECDSPAPND